MSQRSPQQLAAQSYEKALARLLWKLFPNKPSKTIRDSIENVNGKMTSVTPKFREPSSYQLSVIQERLEAFERHIGPIRREGAVEVLLGDQNLRRDRRDVIVRYEDGTELAFDVKGTPRNPYGPVDVTSPRSKAMFTAAGSAGAHANIRERIDQRDLMLELIQNGGLESVMELLMGKYDYWIMDLGKKTIKPWGPQLLKHEWTASESETEFRGETYPSINLHCAALQSNIDICPRRKSLGNDLKWHVTW